jgi:hypothetical protein
MQTLCPPQNLPTCSTPDSTVRLTTSAMVLESTVLLTSYGGTVVLSTIDELTSRLWAKYNWYCIFASCASGIPHTPFQKCPVSGVCQVASGSPIIGVGEMVFYSNSSFTPSLGVNAYRETQLSCGVSIGVYATDTTRLKCVHNNIYHAVS